MKTATGILAAIAAAGMISACGGSNSDSSREKAMEAAAAQHGINADVTLNEDGEVDQVVVSNGFGQAGKNLNLPVGFPDDIDLPDDWEIIGASAPMPGSHSLQLLSKDTAEEIVADLRTRMTAEGWSEAAFATPAPSMTQLNFEKDARMTNFNIIQNGETRAVQLLTMPKP
ncbi:MAG: hypothetical protein KDA53_04665 [Hyphomonas sp.]|nr:hypothetical protein [Hyphomonas sp.]